MEASVDGCPGSGLGVAGRRIPLRLALGLLAGCLLVGAAPARPGEGTLRGVARYVGPPIEPQAIRMNADPKCAELTGDKPVRAGDRLVGPEGELANVFVYLRDGGGMGEEIPVPAEEVTLTQRTCWYRPRVVGVQVKQALSLVNEDPTLHNTRSLAKVNRPFNLSQPAGSSAPKRRFRMPEMAIPLKCDVHPWMAAYVFVMDHRFWSVTGDDGRFEIDQVPPGRHILTAWHEAFGEKTLEVEVAAGANEVHFTFSAEE